MYSVMSLLAIVSHRSEKEDSIFWFIFHVAISAGFHADESESTNEEKCAN